MSRVAITELRRGLREVNDDLKEYQADGVKANEIEELMLRSDKYNVAHAKTPILYQRSLTAGELVNHAQQIAGLIKDLKKQEAELEATVSLAQTLVAALPTKITELTGIVSQVNANIANAREHVGTIEETLSVTEEALVTVQLFLNRRTTQAKVSSHRRAASPTPSSPGHRSVDGDFGGERPIYLRPANSPSDRSTTRPRPVRRSLNYRY